MRFLYVAGFAFFVTSALGCPAEPARSLNDAGVDGFVPCVGDCFPPKVCRADGICADPIIDQDGDGLNQVNDCNDADPSIKAMGERTCHSICEEGVQECVSGVWYPCNATTACPCSSAEEGGTRQIACGHCDKGLQTQRCSSGIWVNEGECRGGGECIPTDTRFDECQNPCTKQTCRDDCTWGPCQTTEGSCELNQMRCFEGKLQECKPAEPAIYRRCEWKNVFCEGFCSGCS